ncbi:hypothetical protein ACLB1M_04835 [Escherichia coli]
MNWSLMASGRWVTTATDPCRVSGGCCAVLAHARDKGDGLKMLKPDDLSNASGAAGGDNGMVGTADQRGLRGEGDITGNAAYIPCQHKIA